MIDPNSQFFAILTATGEAKQANADALGIPWKLTEMGVGDANGTDPIPDRLQKKLINERRRRQLNKLMVDPSNSSILVAEQIIPADEGGWWIREIGLYDAEGDLVAVANCAPSYKPLMSQGSGRTQVVRMNFIVSSAANVVLKIDPAVVLATRQYVDDSVNDAINRQDTKQSVLVATTGPIQLAGAQTIDGVAVPLGARVLVKDQAQAKDNGIYLTAEIWKRATDADTNLKVTPSLLVAVEQGLRNADSLWLLVTDAPVVLGTTPLTFKNLIQGLAPISSPALQGVPTCPTPALTDNGKQVANSEFVRRSQGGRSGYASFSQNVTLGADDLGKLLVGAVSGIVLTLPDPTATAPGQGYYIQAAAGATHIIVATPVGQFSGSNSNGFGSPVLRISSGSSSNFISDGTTWRALGGSGAATLASSGIVKHPNGFMEQWVTGISDAEGRVLVSLPTKFHEGILGGVANERVPGGWSTESVTVWGFDDAASTLSVVAARCRLIDGTLGPRRAVGISCMIRVWGK